MSAAKFIENYCKCTEELIDAEGINPAPAWLETGDGKITIEAMAVSAEDNIKRHVKARYTSNPSRKIIFGLDRSTKNGQGTTLSDVFTIWFWETGEPDWRTGVIEYQHEPRIVKSICWTNEFWNQKMKEEIESFKPVKMPWHKDY